MKRLNIAKQWELNKALRKQNSLLADVDAFIARCQAYFDWCDRSPWEKTELVKHKGDWSEAEIPLGRHYSIDELCTFLGVSTSYFRSVKAVLRERIDEGKQDAQDEDRLAAVEFVETHIRAQNISGAVVGVFKENIIARFHNLHDTTNVNRTGEAAIKIVVRDEATAQALKDLDAIL